MTSRSSRYHAITIYSIFVGGLLDSWMTGYPDIAAKLLNLYLKSITFVGE